MQHPKEHSAGQFLFIKQADHYLLYKILEVYPLLVRAYWPLYEKPDWSDYSVWEIQTACTLLLPEVLTQATLAGFEPVNTIDLEEITRYQAIQTSKTQRTADFKAGLEIAQALFESGNYAEAILKINEIAPYHKLNFELYRLRGIANFQLGHWHDARFDLRYYIEESGESDPGLLEMIQHANQRIQPGK